MSASPLVASEGELTAEAARPDLGAAAWWAPRSGHGPKSGEAAGPSHGQAPMGRLELAIEARSGRSVAVHQYHQGALRVMRPHYLDDSGQVCYVVVNPGGAYLGADLFL